MRGVLGCVKVRDVALPALGSSRDVCSDCREPVWIAPSGRLMVSELGLRILCVQCARPGTAEIVPPSAEQLREIDASLRWYREHRN